MHGLRKIIVYIAGPYSAPTRSEIEANIKRAHRVNQELWRLGYTGFCPHKNTEGFERTVPELAHEDYLKGDKAMLERFDAVLMLDG